MNSGLLALLQIQGAEDSVPKSSATILGEHSFGGQRKIVVRRATGDPVPARKSFEAEAGEETDCPPADAPTHIAVHIDYECTYDGCDGSNTVTAEIDAEDDLDPWTFFGGFGCFSQTITGESDPFSFSCVACAPLYQDRFINTFFALGWTGSTWQFVYAIGMSGSDDPEGFCGDTSDFRFEQDTEDLGAADPAGVHIITLSDASPTKSATITVTLT